MAFCLWCLGPDDSHVPRSSILTARASAGRAYGTSRAPTHGSRPSAAPCGRNRRRRAARGTPSGLFAARGRETSVGNRLSGAAFSRNKERGTRQLRKREACDTCRCVGSRPVPAQRGVPRAWEPRDVSPRRGARREASGAGGNRDTRRRARASAPGESGSESAGRGDQASWDTTGAPCKRRRGVRRARRRCKGAFIWGARREKRPGEVACGQGNGLSCQRP